MVRLFGEKLRYLRRQHGLTQTALAQRLQIAQHAYISNLEAARYSPSLRLIVRIAELFGVRTDYLLHDNVPVEPPLLYGNSVRTGEEPTLALLGHKIRHLRRRNQLTQATLAQQLGLARQGHI